MREVRRRATGEETKKRRRGRSKSRGRSIDSRRRRGSKNLMSWGIQAIQPRDMRKIDPHFSSGVDAVLLVRRSALIFSMAHIAAVVLHDRCYLVVPQGADSILSVMMDRLRDIEIFSSSSKKEEDDDGAEETKNETNKDDENGKIATDESNIIPFEFLALEAMLATMRDSISKKLKDLETRAREALSKLRQNVLTQGRETLFMTSEELHDAELRVNAIENALKEVLDCDEDMACMYLTRLEEDPDAFDDPDFNLFHEEVELLLESYVVFEREARELLFILSLSHTDRNSCSKCTIEMHARMHTRLDDENSNTNARTQVRTMFVLNLLMTTWNLRILSSNPQHSISLGQIKTNRTDV